MKKVLMLMMAAALIGLVGCGSEPQVDENLPTPTEKIEEVVAASTETPEPTTAPTETPIPTATTAPTETPVPTPTVAATPTSMPTETMAPTPFPSPTPAIEEESEVTNEVIDYKIDPNTGEKIEVLATPTPEPSPIVEQQSEKKYAKIKLYISDRYSDNPTYVVYFELDTPIGAMHTCQIVISAEEYEMLTNKTTALIEVEVLPESFYLFSPDRLYTLQVYSYEIVE